MTRPAFVYLLHSVKTGGYYLGWTTDVSRRLEEHNKGKSVFTKSRGPWELIGCEVCRDAKTAQQREKMLKQRPRQFAQLKKRMVTVFRTASGGPGQVVG